MLSTSAQYRRCYTKSFTNAWRRRSRSIPHAVYCPTVPCSDGLTFDIERLKCVANERSLISALTTQTIPATEHRTHRDIKQSDYNLDSPQIPEATTPTPSPIETTTNRNINSKAHKKLKRVKIKRRLEKKLKLASSQSSSQLARRIYDQYNNKRALIEDNSPGDIVISLKKQRGSISCKPLVKTNYVVLHAQSHYLFCSVDVP